MGNKVRMPGSTVTTVLKHDMVTGSTHTIAIRITERLNKDGKQGHDTWIHSDSKEERETLQAGWSGCMPATSRSSASRIIQVNFQSLHS
jgi:hypothetical protein